MTGRNLEAGLGAPTIILRAQINSLQNILRSIEEGGVVEDYMYENLKVVEKNLRWLRKLFFNN